MKIALGSDLHLEIQDINLRNTEKADVLILAGDILIANDLHDHPRPDVPYTEHEISRLGTRQAHAHRFRGFLDRVSQEFPRVLIVAGNHEFYDGKWVASLTHLRQEYAWYENITFLERDMVTIDDVVFVGGTLWTDVNRFDPLTLHALSTLMQDYTLIRNDDLGYTKLKPATTAQRHRQTVEYFKYVLDENRMRKCVVIGHHGPTHMSIPPWYRDQTIMNGGYVSDLSVMILDRPQIKYWFHGHTHNPLDYMVGFTRVICNPRGYAGYEARANQFELVFVDV